MRAIITAGGRGTRLRPLTFTLNKHLVPIANKPMIFFALEKIAHAGINEVGIIINPGDTELPTQIGDGSTWGFKITYIPQEGGALGLAHAVASAKKFVDNEPFLFYLGDNIVLTDLTFLIDRFNRDNLSALLAFSKVHDPQRFGVPEFDGDKLVRVIEKPANPTSDFAVTGIYIYSPDIFDAVSNIKPSHRGELEISDAHTWLLENEKAVSWEEITGWWKDTGKPEDLLECNQLVLDNLNLGERGENILMSASANIQGRVSIGSNVTIGDNTLINGPTIIGDNCVVENSYVGPYTSLGPNVKVFNTEIQNSIVLSGADINAHANIVASLIGTNAFIRSAKESIPLGHKLIVGDNSVLEL